MSYQNPFLKQAKEYKRDFYPIKHYVHQMSYYLHVMTGKDLEVCSNWIKNKLKNHQLGSFKDPIVHYLHRQDNYDRVEVDQPLSKLLADIIREKELMAPSLTTYKNPKIEKSLVAESTENNVVKRNVAKKAMFAYEAEENIAKDKNDLSLAQQFYLKWFFAEKTQINTKLSNNAVSGMFNNAGNPLFDPTGHSTLTSNCRMTSGYGNANNEKLLTGNRHYWSSDVTMFNIISIIANSNYEKIGEFIKANNFYIPSATEVIKVIEYSSKIYWKDSLEMKKIVNLVNKLNDLQRAAFVYTGDLYHIRKFNDEYVKGFISKLITKVEDTTYRDAKDIKKLPEDIVIWAHHICYNELKGKGKNYDEIKGTKELGTLYATTVNICETLQEYSSFVETFLMTDNIPASVPRFPDSIRRSALISDTDSTIFTVQEWVQWFTGRISFNDTSIAVGASMIAIAAQSITHVLAIMSANDGIGENNLREIAMKNEFFFPVIVPTRVAKHYFGAISVQEGNVKAETEYEIKGVHLKSSNAPKFVNDAAKKMMKEILDCVMEGKKISIVKLLKDVANMEIVVLNSVLKGEGSFFRGGQIQTLDSYKGKDTPEKTNFFHYMLWQEVFAQKYGAIAEPPYSVYKLSTSIGSPTLTQKWIENMQDRQLAERLLSFMSKYNKKYFGTFWLPQSYISQYGLPIELQEAIGVRHMVADVCKVFYIILETLGYYGLNNKETNMVMDYYQPDGNATLLDDTITSHLKKDSLTSKYIETSEPIFVDGDENRDEEQVLDFDIEPD